MQYVGLAINFKQRFRIYKSDIKTNKDRCGTVYFLCIYIYICILWPHGRESLALFLDYINTIDPTEKIKFTMEVAEPGNYLELLDLKLTWENGKIMVDVHSKPTNLVHVRITYCMLSQEKYKQHFT